MFKWMHKVFAVAFMLTLVACGYHVGTEGELTKYQTVSIPYISGDTYGSLTTAVVDQLAESGSLRFVSSDSGDLQLKLAIASRRSENTGFQYPKQVAEDQRLVASQKKKEVLVYVRLEDSATGELVIPEQYLSVGTEYDFLPIGRVEENILGFSLGQLDSHEGASEFSELNLNERIARKVVEYIYSSPNL